MFNDAITDYWMVLDQVTDANYSQKKQQNWREIRLLRKMTNKLLCVSHLNRLMVMVPSADFADAFLNTVAD